MWTPSLILGGAQPATSVAMRNRWGIAVDVDGNVFVADADNNRIRRIDADDHDETRAASASTF